MSITSVSFYKLLELRGVKDPSCPQFSFSCPFSLRKLPDKPSDLKMKNDFATIPIIFPLIENFNTAL